MVMWTSAKAEYKRYFRGLRAQKGKADRWAQMKAEHITKPQKVPTKTKKATKAAVEPASAPTGRKSTQIGKEVQKKRGPLEMEATKATVEDTIAKRTRHGKRKETQRDGGEDGWWVNIASWSPAAMDFDWSNEFQHGPMQHYPPTNTSIDDGKP